MEKQYVSFELNHNKYCIDIINVKEVAREHKITIIPDSPYFVEGIMNLRGVVIPVLSIKKKLGLRDDADVFDSDEDDLLIKETKQLEPEEKEEDFSFDDDEGEDSVSKKEEQEEKAEEDENQRKSEKSILDEKESDNEPESIKALRKRRRKKKHNSKLIIISLDEVWIGFLADNLDRVFTIDDTEVQAPERINESSIDRSMIDGVTKVEDNIYLILNIKKLLGNEEREFIKQEFTE